eukprot:TRINITY_DN18232_c0_g2_i5.p1 TRINITY_DN18232_c0_g2~~TRINITY_DN18232_c0_g2_i5.p1  ORF type:complete len:111 (+),score=11.20 TRINITY_DN18232_c0_g2_i5:289-621(+)
MTASEPWLGGRWLAAHGGTGALPVRGMYWVKPRFTGTLGRGATSYKIDSTGNAQNWLELLLHGWLDEEELVSVGGLLRARAGLGQNTGRDPQAVLNCGALWDGPVALTAD